jgi:hypothetical protein
MKTISEPSVISSTILILAVLAGAILFVILKGVKVPLLSNPKVALGILIVLGMTICAQGGIGRIAAVGNWAHPQAILGYILGTVILLVATSIFFNFKLPFITSQQQAFVIITVLLGAKILNAFAHYYFFTRR